MSQKLQTTVTLIVLQLCELCELAKQLEIATILQNTTQKSCYLPPAKGK